MVNPDIQWAFRQLHKIEMLLLDETLSPIEARGPLQNIINRNLPADSQFARYNDQLLSLEDQVPRLRDYNERLWGNWLTDKQFAALNTESDHVQSVDDLEFYHVEGASPEETEEMWWRVHEATQLKRGKRSDDIQLDRAHYRRGARTQRYEPGIHLVRINLVAHWEPEYGRTIEEVFEKAKHSDQTLAHSEVHSAYGSHPWLLAQQNGVSLPFAEMAGSEVMVRGEKAWRRVLCLEWSEDDGVILSTHWVGFRNYMWAVPVLRKS